MAIERRFGRSSGDRLAAVLSVAATIADGIVADELGSGPEVSGAGPARSMEETVSGRR